MTSDERNRLLDDLLEGEISEANFLRLEAEMIIDEEVRVAYYDRLKLQTGLEKEAHAAHSEPEGSRGPVPKSRRPLDPILLGAIALLLVLVAVLAFRIREDNQMRIATDEPVAVGFGVVSELSDASWEGDEKPARGDLVRGEMLSLEAGLVQIELFNGVVLFVSGETVFSLRSDEELEIRSGNVRVRVPPMVENFQLVAPQGRLQGKALEFSVGIKEGLATAKILQGNAEWVDASGESSSLPAGFSYTMSDSGEASRAGLDLSENSGPEQGLADHRAQREAGWKESSRALREDSRVLAYYSMDGSLRDGSPILRDLSGAGNDGVIVRAQRSTNRWGNSGSSLDFTPTGSRVRLFIPGEYESLSLMCWVRIDSLDRLYNSLFLTDGHELHEPHWQILNDGRLFLSVRAHDRKGAPDKYNAYSPSIWDRTRSGQWHHLVSVYDGGSQTMTHYVDGEAISIDPIPEDLRPDKVTIGAASIGNWSEPRYRKDPEFAVRNLNGAIDEFAIFSEALDAVEVRSLFEAGKL